MCAPFASRLLASAGCVAAALVGGCSNHASSATLPEVDSGGAALVYVGRGGMQFVPANITIDAGATVEWYWLMDDHSVTSGDGKTCTPDNGFDTGIHSAGFSFSHQFIDSGTYNYYCVEHCPVMTGSVTVR
jgi:aldose sugar dehydrogenase